MTSCIKYKSLKKWLSVECDRRGGTNTHTGWEQSGGAVPPVEVATLEEVEESAGADCSICLCPLELGDDDALGVRVRDSANSNTNTTSSTNDAVGGLTTLSAAAPVKRPRSNSVATTSCGHAFHAQCLTMWLSRGSSSCPLCRVDLEDSEVPLALPESARRREKCRTRQLHFSDAFSLKRCAQEKSWKSSQNRFSRF